MSWPVIAAAWPYEGVPANHQENRGAAGLMTPLVTNCAMHYHGWAAVTTEHGLAVWHSIRVCKGEVRWGAEEKG